MRLARSLIVSWLLISACGGTEESASTPPAPARVRTPPSPPPAVVQADAGTTPDAGPAAPPTQPLRFPTRPTVAMETPRVEGPVAAAAVQRVLQEESERIVDCYKRQLRTRPDLQGRVELRFGITPDGQSADESIASSTVGSPELEACITRAVGFWELPRPRGGAAATVTVPYAFSVEVVRHATPADIQWTLTFQPPRIALGNLARLRILITAHNRSTATVESGRTELAFTVNGEGSMGLDHAFGNGGLEADWFAMLPGRTLQDERIGVDFVESRGEHVVVMYQRMTDVELARATLRVW